MGSQDRCDFVSPTPWGASQCALPASHAGEHSFSPSEAIPEPKRRLGWWVMSGEDFLSALRRAADGEDPDLIYAEQYANSDVEHVEGEDRDD